MLTIPHIVLNSKRKGKYINKHADKHTSGVRIVINRSINMTETEIKIQKLKLREAFRQGAEVGAEETVEAVLAILEEKRNRVINIVLYNEMREEICKLKP